MSESVTLKSYFYEVLIPSSQKNTSSPIEDILHHVSISFMKKLALYKCFNPRTHTGCDTSPKNNGSYYDCFNPRTHTGCDFIRSVKHLIVRVSIHAPTRGATMWFKFVFSRNTFQSTHPHGVRHEPIEFDFGIYYVSIHAPTRGATLLRGGLFTQAIVSIHAPTRGATAKRRPIYTSYRFNPRTHTGCDAMWFKFVFSRNTFQSTHPHGVRLFLDR